MAFATTAYADTPVGYGISVFLTVDVGAGYESEGAPPNSAFTVNNTYNLLTTSRNFSGAQESITSSAMEQSRFGVAIDEPLGSSGFHAVGRLESGFNPLSGTFGDVCKAFTENAGVPALKQTASSDSSRCGQLLNGVAYGGVANNNYGTLTFGRQMTLQGDLLGDFDSNLNSTAFSLFGYVGSPGGGGSTEALRLDNSVKYFWGNQYFHAAAMFAQGGNGTGVLGHSYGGRIGANYNGFAIDAVAQRITGALNLRDASTDTQGTPLSAYASTNTSYSVAGRYIKKLSNKASLGYYLGYEHYEKADANEYPASTPVFGEGDYAMNLAFDIGQSAQYDVVWAGVRYTTPSNTVFALGNYYIHQNSFTISPSGKGCAQAGLLCSGSWDMIAGFVDMPVLKHLDVYVGANWNKATDGLAYGYPSNPSTTGTAGSISQTGLYTGMRLKF